MTLSANDTLLIGYEATHTNSYYKEHRTAVKWKIHIYAGAINTLLGIGAFRSFGVLMLELMTVYEGSTAKFSLTLSFVAIGFCTSALLYALGIGDIFHERALILVSTLISFCGFLAGYLSTRLEHIFILSVCAGFSGQVGASASLALVGKYFDKRVSVANGLTMAGISVGALSMAPVAQFLFGQFTYRGGCLILAGLVLNGFVAASLMRPAILTRRVNKKVGNASEIELQSRTESKPCPIPDTEAEISGFSRAQHREVVKNGVSNAAFSSEENVCYIKKNEPSLIDETSPPSKTIPTGKPKVTFRNTLKRFVFKPQENSSVKWHLRKLLGELASFKKPSFVLFQLYGVFSQVAIECFLQFLPALASENGISLEQAPLLVTVVGAGDLVCRVATGLLGDNVSRGCLVMIPQFVLGVACFLSQFATEFWSLILLAAVIGLMSGTNDALRAVLLIDLFGLTDLQRNIGISYVLSSAGIIGGSPLIGYLRDTTGDYDLPMQVIGLFFVAGGLCLAAIMATGFCKRCKFSWKYNYEVG